MSLFKGNLSSSGEFTAQDDVRGLRLIAPGTVPSWLSLETADGVKWYMFINDSDEWIMHTSAPTAGTAGVGNIITGAGNSGANKTLSNLGTVAFAVDLLPGTTASYDLGSTSKYLAEVYSAKYLGHANATLTGATGGWTVAGITTFGSDGGAGNADILWYGHTATSYITFDETEDALTFEDDTLLKIGTGNDFIVDPDGTDVNFDCTTDDTIWNIGPASDVDVKFHSHDNADQDAGWISDIYTFQVTTAAILQVGGSAFDTVTEGVRFEFNGNTLSVDAVVAQDSISIGENTVTDFELFGNAYDIIWDASEDEFRFGDNVEVQFGAGKDLQIESDGTLVNFTFPATDSGIVIAAYAAQTVSVLDINGDTDWDGADTVGMLHLRHDTPLIHRGASLFYVDSSGTPVANADGFMMRLIDGGANTASTFAVEMYSAANNIMEMHTGAVGVIPLTIAPHTNATASALSIDAGTDGFVGAANTGLVNISMKGTLAQTTASALRIDANGTYKANSEGACLFIDDDMTAAGTDYSVYVNTLDAACMKLETQDIAEACLVLENATNATAAVLYVDGSANGWIGADDTGMVHIENDTANTNVGATQLLVESSYTPKAASEGFLARFLHTGTAVTDGYAVEIEVPATQPALDVNNGVRIVGGATFANAVLQVTGENGTNNTVAVDVHNEGTGAAVQITGDDVDSLQLKAIAKASQTSSMVIIDGRTTDWIGNADDVGMVSLIHGTTALAHNGGTMLYVSSDAIQKSGAEGTLARFECKGASAQADAIAVEIIAKDATEYALNVGSGMAKFAHAVTFTAGQQSTPVAVTANATKASAAIPSGTTFVIVTSDTATKFVELPTPVQGHVIWLTVGATGYELIANDSTTEYLNNAVGTGADDASSSVAANTLVRAVAVDTTHWVATQFSLAGTESALEAACST